MLRSLVEDGHEIGSHSVTHHPTKMPTQPEIEASESKRLIEGWVGTKVSSFCYPFYRSHAYLAGAVKNAGYEQARGGGVQPLQGPQASYYAISGEGLLDPLNIDCRQISKNENVTGWIRPGFWHVLTFHGIGGPQDGWEPITEEQFAGQMAELAKQQEAGAVEIVTFKDGANRVRPSEGQPVTASSACK
jgi:peptidoglycan/xylan/chitin deacetylase (PgdA/CDA1 family)